MNSISLSASLTKSFLLSFLTIFLFFQLQAQKNIPVEKFTLENGLTVYLNEDFMSPKVFGVVVTKAGGKNDPANATGMAHYMEHMLFKGTTELGTTDWEKEKVHIDKIFELYDILGTTTADTARKRIQKEINEQSLAAAEYSIPNEMSNILNKMGGTSMNAGTGPDNTFFYNAFPSNQMERWLELYSHRFQEPVFRSFQAELEVVYEEKNMYSDMFIFKILEEFNKKFFKSHPYGQQPLIGTIEHLKNPSLTKMYDFFKTYYVANNMALILSGNFKAEEVKPMIIEKFSKLSSGTIPAAKVWEEQPFNGREYYEDNLSPVKVGLLGFRTPSSKHPDELAMEICNGILSNSSQTGLLDKLTIDNKLLAAQVLPMPYQDHGATIILAIPKIIGQKLEEAEKLVLDELEKLKKGEFEVWMVEAIKQELIKNFYLEMENPENKALLISNIFALNLELDDYLSYPEKVVKISRQDVLDVAAKYYGSNFIAFYSKMGFPKKEKIEKPGFEPLVANTNATSAFATNLEKIPVKDPVLEYIDFKKIVSHTTLQQNLDLYVTNNPLNSIFSLKFRFGVGEYLLPDLKYAAQIMNFSGVDGRDVNTFKNEMGKIGCNYSISCSDSYLTIKLEGPDNNLGKCLELVNELINIPDLDPEKLKSITQGIRAERMMEKSEPDNVASALYEYVKYKENSSYLRRKTIAEIKGFNTDSLVSVFQKATKYAAEIHYVGQISASEIQTLLKNKITFSSTLSPSTSPVVMAAEKYSENCIYFVDKKKAVQSKIYLFANGKAFNKEDLPVIEAFNIYFGGGFSGLVLQEIREYRSLAYGAGARFKAPPIIGAACDFIGFVGTQADKTLEALEIFYRLIREMPDKRERADMIKLYLTQSAFTEKPNLRNLSEEISAWEKLGYTDDPNKEKLPVYNNITFDDITAFYKENLKDKPIVIAFVGDKKKIDMKELQKYGKIIEVKQKKLFN